MRHCEPGIAAMAASATLRLEVTRYADESGPCSASINRSSAAMRPSAVSSASTMDSLGPAGMPVSSTPASSRLAATTQGLPGPTIFVHCLTLFVP